MDAHDNITSRDVCDKVLGNLLRLYAQHRWDHPEGGELFALDDPTLRDLLALHEVKQEEEKEREAA